MPYGLTVHTAFSGKQAVEIVKMERNKYDVIFMDHMMPGMDGMEATQAIRGIGTEYTSTVSIVALTANATSGAEENFLANGFNAFIPKPVDVKHLDMVLNKWIRARHMDEALKVEAEENAKGSDTGKAEGAALQYPDGLHLKGLDYAAGVTRYMNEAVYLQILSSYAVNTSQLLELMKGLSEETLKDYAITVHGIKGSSHGICADEAARRASELESAAKADDFVTVLANNDAFIEYMKSFLGNLSNFLHSIKANEGEKERAPSPDKKLLRDLLDFAKSYRAVQIDDSLTKLERFEYDSGEELVSWLRNQADNLEYGAIRDQLEKELEE
jgi:CheY-like chemotaxis protein